MATPNVLRLETEETVTVTTYGAKGLARFTLYLQDYPERKRKFSERSLVVEKGRFVGYQFWMSVLCFVLVSVIVNTLSISRCACMRACVCVCVRVCVRTCVCV